MCALYVCLQSLPARIPPGRNYTVVGNLKIMFPQWRVMKSDFPGRLVCDGGCRVVCAGGMEGEAALCYFVPLLTFNM